MYVRCRLDINRLEWHFISVLDRILHTVDDSLAINYGHTKTSKTPTVKGGKYVYLSNENGDRRKIQRV